MSIERICAMHQAKFDKAREIDETYFNLDEFTKKIILEQVNAHLSYLDPYVKDIMDAVAQLSNNQSVKISFAVKNGKKMKKVKNEIWVHFA